MARSSLITRLRASRFPGRTSSRRQTSVRAFTRAYIRGWRDYLDGDPTPAHAAMKAANDKNTDDFMMFSRQMIIGEKLVTGRDADGGPAKIGRLDPARFAAQIALLEELRLLRKGKVTVESAMTTEFLPK